MKDILGEDSGFKISDKRNMIEIDIKTNRILYYKFIASSAYIKIMGIVFTRLDEVYLYNIKGKVILDNINNEYNYIKITKDNYKDENLLNRIF